MSDAIQLLCHDDAYRRHLEINARAYYDQYLCPDSVMTRILDYGS
jgi:hypothetical protein